MGYIAFFLISMYVSPVYANQPKVDMIEDKNKLKVSQSRYPKPKITVKSTKNNAQSLIDTSQVSALSTKTDTNKDAKPTAVSRVPTPNIVYENASDVIEPSTVEKKSKFSFASIKNKMKKSSSAIDQSETASSIQNKNVEIAQIKPKVTFNSNNATKADSANILPPQSSPMQASGKKTQIEKLTKNKPIIVPNNVAFKPAVTPLPIPVLATASTVTPSPTTLKPLTATVSPLTATVIPTPTGTAASSLKKNKKDEANVVAPSNKKKKGLSSLKDNLQSVFKPKSSDEFRKVQLNELSNFEYRPDPNQSLPIISGKPQSGIQQSSRKIGSKVLTLDEAVKLAVSKHPEISQSISDLASQNANIDVARSGYYPQLSGGVSTGDMTSGERGRQLLSLNASQMLFDFGKVKSGVSTQEARLLTTQAQVLVTIDQISLEVANAIVNIRRYEEITRIAREQIKGISRIAEIANLRAKAGISSQADPIQAQSYLEAAQSNLIVQETQLKIFKQRLRTLLGADISNTEWKIPDSLIARSDIYKEPEFNKIPKMMLAKAQADVASSEKKQTELSRYPTLNIKGSLSQALNGRNPNNNVDNGSDSAIMFEATSNFYQGGAVASQTRAASFAEEAAKARINSVYLETIDLIRSTQEQVENKQRQMQVLASQQATTVRTKELYQEQYKLGTRTAVDLLNAEQAIHSANQQIETARYDIYENLVQYIAAAGKTRDVYQLNNLTIQGVELQP